MLWLAVALFGLLLGALARLPQGFALVLFGVLGSLSVLALLASPERAPGALLLALVVGLFFPPVRPARAPRVAPRKGRVRVTPVRQTAPGEPAAGAARDSSSPFDLWDIPGYEVLEKVGSGGMASVFRARRKRDGETVALKVPNDAFVNDEKFIRRFHREAEVAQRLSHPNIVRTFEHGSVGAKHFMVMEYVDGCSLEAYIDRPENRADYAASCELMQQAVRALSHIHEAGVVHRDIKPANLMLREASFSADAIAPDALKLMDFGIAGGQVLAKLTVMGTRVGTPSYMSPEQARGLRTDERSDIYSLGLVFYELLTGQPAFKGGYEVIVHQQIFQVPPTPRQLEARIPPRLERLVMQMIAKEPAERPSLAEIEYRLAERCEVGEAPSRSRLLCALGAPQGALRILDTGGNLRGGPGDVGASLPAPPQACVGDAHGNLYVAVTEAADLGADHAMLHKLGPDGALLRSFGPYGTKPGEFLRPVALATAPDGSLWVLDAETHRVEHFSAEGVYLGGFGGEGDGEGRFRDPRDLLSDAHGELFVLDYGNRQVQHFSADGRYQNRWAFRLPGAAVGVGPDGLRPLSGFALGGDGDLYLGEASGGKVHRITPKGGALNTVALREADDLRPDTLLDLGVDEVGNLFAAERGGSAIRKYAPSGELLATLETYAPIVQLRVDVKS